MPAAFTSTDAHDRGMLDTGGGNLVYWEVRGNPDASPRSSSTADRGRESVRHPKGIRPGALPDHPVRPARVRTQHAACERSCAQHASQPS